MKFILNTSLDPHFCALFDIQGRLIDSLRWYDRKKMGNFVWNFLEKNQIPEKELNFIGGISGPGGFSNLRGAAGILNILSLRFGIPIHQIRADFFIENLLKENGSKGKKFLLNSFSDRVFYSDEKNDLVRITLEESIEKWGKSEIFVGFLPEEKQQKFLKKIMFDLDDIEKSLLKTLETRPPQRSFIPDYEFPAVQD